MIITKLFIMIIYGIGLPRTGTNSLSKMLQQLGFNGHNYCCVNNFKNVSYTSSVKIRYIVENDFYQKRLENYNVKSNKFILTHRNNIDWKMSIDKFKDADKLKDIHTFYYKSSIQGFFNKNNCNENLLVLNICDEAPEVTLMKLKLFLEIKDDDLYVPHINLNDNSNWKK
jgi:hypothetical protein